MSQELDVLVVDDEPKIGQLLTQILTARNCTVRCVSNGLDALNQFKEKPADIVITDMRMPKLSGMELVRELKAIDPMINVVVITAYPSIEGAVDAMRHGACDFITKPFDINQIQAILYRCQQRLSLTKQLQNAGEGMIKLEELNRRLAEMNDMKSQFLAAISHEINTPLCIMGEWMYLLSDNTLGALSGKQEQAVDVLLGAYGRLQKILQQLIDLMNGHQIVLQRQVLNAQELVHQALAPIMHKAAARSITVSCQLPETPFLIEADRKRFTSAVEYVLDNAVKFSNEHGHIEVEMTATSDLVQLRIRDTGIGIAPDELEKVYEPFYQVDRRLNKVYEGSGIGLTLAKRYIELHNGTLQLSSEVNIGTMIIIAIPRLASTEVLETPIPTTP